MDNGNDDDTKYFVKLRVWLVGLDIKLRKLIRSSPIYHFAVYPSRTQYIVVGWGTIKAEVGCAMPWWAITFLFCPFSCRSGALRFNLQCLA